MCRSLFLLAFLTYCCILHALVTKSIVLLGDSLINRPYKQHGLGGKIQALVSNVHLNLINAGNDGQVIKQIYERTQSVLDEHKPDAVILFWDSDCSNYDESTMSKEAVQELRGNFSQNLFMTIKTILTSGAKLAVAGPEILGEGPIGLQSHFKNKNGMLDAYRTLTRNAAQEAGVPYIDMRAAFLKAIPNWWLFYAGIVTVDGEHPNDKGASIEAKLFANQINAWYN